MSITVAVLGSSGNQGGTVAKALASSGKYHVRCVVRDPQSHSAKSLTELGSNITLTKGDLSDKASLVTAFEGVQVVFACTPRTPNEEKLGKCAADAALAAKVKLFIWSSLPSVKRLSKNRYTKVVHFDAKEAVELYARKIGLKTLVLHLGIFAENDINFHSIQKGEDGYIKASNGLKVDKPFPYICIGKDLGPAVKLLIGHYLDRSVPDHPIHIVSYNNSIEEQVSILSKVLGQHCTVQDTPMSGDEMKEMIDFFNDFALYSDAKLPDPILTGLGWVPTSYEVWVREELAPVLNASA